MNRKLFFYCFLFGIFLICVSSPLWSISSQFAVFDPIGNFSSIAAGFYLPERGSLLYVPAKPVFGNNLNSPSGFLSCLKIKNVLIVNGVVSLIASETEILELGNRFEKKTGKKVNLSASIPAEFSMQVEVNDRVVFVKKRSGGSLRRFPIQFQTRDLKPEELRIKIVWEIFPEKYLWGKIIVGGYGLSSGLPITRKTDSGKITIHEDRITLENIFVAPFKEVTEFKRN